MCISSRFFIILYTTALCVASIYAPQPILRTLAKAFSVNASAVSLCITVVMLPLGFAPILYGFILESVPVRKIVLTALFILAASQFAAAAVGSLEAFLAVRFVQGLCIPALLTSLMSAAAENTGGKSVRAAMSIYVAATVVGGLAGRILTGLTTTVLGWRASFILLGLAALAALYLIRRMPPSGNATFHRPSLNVIPRILSRPGYLRGYLLVFCIFFVFTSLMNILPFRLAELSKGISDFSTSLAYSGYLVGILGPSIFVRLSDRFGGKSGTLRLGLVDFLASLAILFIPNTSVYIVGIFFVCAGFFFVSSLTPGYIAAGISDHRPLASGLYLSFQYVGAALGSFLPGLAYNYLGYDWYQLILLFILALALVLCPGHIGLAAERRSIPAPASGADR